MTRTFAWSILCHLSIYCITKNHGCLENTPAVTHNATGNDIEWHELSSNVFSTTFVFDVSNKNWFSTNEINAQITTRLFNHSLPSPTIRMKRGNQYQVTILNDLDQNSDLNPSEANVLKDPNTTNIYLHGLHLSGQSPSNNIFSLFIHSLSPYFFSFQYIPNCNERLNLSQRALVQENNIHSFITSHAITVEVHSGGTLITTAVLIYKSWAAQQVLMYIMELIKCPKRCLF